MDAIDDHKIQLAKGLLSNVEASEADWAQRERKEARARFEQMGAPVKRDEYWRYSDPAKLTAPMAPIAPAPAPHAIGGPFAGETPELDPLEGPPAEWPEPLHVVFVNGRFSPELSSDLAGAPLNIAPLSAAMAAPDGAAIGRLEHKAQLPVARPMAALNAAMASDGVVLTVEDALERPVHLRYLTIGEGASYLRHRIEVAPGASVTVLESGAGGARFNSAMEVILGEGARFDHVRSQAEMGAADQLATAIFAELGPKAQFKSFTLSAAAQNAASFARNETIFWLEGDDASAHVAGAVLGGGDALTDNTVFITHDAENCESRQVFKTVLDGAARGVFQGKILVKKDAQKTDGYQISQSLLLSDAAEFDAKPELEIYADDVKCSHGSTTGAVDETSLFYLRARGVEREQAVAMLVAAFVDEAIEEIEQEGLRDLMRAEVAAWMRGRAG